MSNYNHKEVEKKWQENWEKSKIFVTPTESEKPKEYVLDFFPYPSGEGLHVGHLKGYSATDVYSHLKRRQGYNVLHPIGWDAFGLPAENFAIKKGIHPAITTARNIELSKKQLVSMGLSFDWNREINTTDPDYYKWTQWIFLKLFEKGLAYEAEMPINWCPSCKTGLANEEVVSGGCERCGTEVTKKNIRQWVLKITAYADRLLSDLEGLDWPTPVVAMQKNWIGRSEGAEIEFRVLNSESRIKVFTTRADTLFGATFMVLAPEHPLVEKLVTEGQRGKIGKYIEATLNKSDVERQEEGRNKTGVFTGSYAINPVNNEKIPIWIADYVLMGYGTGAIMAVPAHDERDWDFAKKFKLPIRQVIAPVFVDPTNPPKKDAENTIRYGVIVLVKHWKEDKYLLDYSPKFNWKCLFTGGVEKGEDALEAAVREIREETGYQNIKSVRYIDLEHIDKFHAPHKGVNRHAYQKNIYVELADGEYEEPSEEEKELHHTSWHTKEEMVKEISLVNHRYIFETEMMQGRPWTDTGVLANSGEFNDMSIEEAQKAIVSKLTKTGYAKKTVNYKLRDWLFSRQRYWGEPIPLIHCEKCGVVPVPESDLPLTLPEVEKYEPTGTGESPLATIESWVNTKCPKCGGPGKRETNTMPQWAGSCWYFMRYVDPKNQKNIGSAKDLKHWLPVDFYVGGAEHAVLHLLYARFWYKFLYDIGVAPTSEPFQKLRNVGLILSEDGRKMSKSLGNVVNPNEIIEEYGADVLKIYELFMGPFEQTASWSMKGVQGVSRFLKKANTLFDGKIIDSEPSSAELRLLNHSIKKVGEDIEEFRFNTAISQLMILVNELGKNREQSRQSLKILLFLLAPFAPFMTEELWEQLGEKGSIHLQDWPKYGQHLLEEEIVTIVVQINGKVRANIEMNKNCTQKEVEEKAFSEPNVQKFLEGQKPKKVIYIANKIINIVV